MNLLIDESVDKQIVTRLRQAGHDVLYVAEMEPGITDDLVLSRANDKSALLVTADKDFGELVFRQGQINVGVVLVRLLGLSNEKKAEIVAAVIEEHSADLHQAFTVISPGNIRIRQKPQL